MALQPGQRVGGFERAPWRRPRGTHEVVEYLFRHHFDEVVEKLGRHPHTRNTSRSYREALASEALKRMLESGQFDRYESGAVGTWIVQSVFRHRNEQDRGAVRLTVTEADLVFAPMVSESRDDPKDIGFDAMVASTSYEPETALEDKERDLAALELRAHMSSELQQFFQLRWEQGLAPRDIRSHFGWSAKQYEKRDAKLKAIVLAAVERSVPDSIVSGRGDGSICVRTRELLPLVFREDGRITRVDRVRVDAHLIACHACHTLARRAERVMGAARPLFDPVSPPVSGGIATDGGLIAGLWTKLGALLGFGGTGAAAATKVAGVAGCVAACVAGSQALIDQADEPSREPRAAEVQTKPTRTSPTRPSATPTTTTTRSTPPAKPARATASTKPKTRTTVPSPPRRQSPLPVQATAAVRAPEFLPESPPASNPAAPSGVASAPASSSPSTGGSSSGAEFAGP